MGKPDPANMGALLRRMVINIRRREGISQNEVARRAGLDPGSLCRSFRHVSSASAVRRVCCAFGFHVEVVEDAKK